MSPRIILGKLPDSQTIYGYAAGTYGLYAENVLLKGSLVTQTNTTGSITYSGISTLYSGPAQQALQKKRLKNLNFLLIEKVTYSLAAVTLRVLLLLMPE